MLKRSCTRSIGSPLAPDLPAVGEALPGYASEAAIGFFAPKKTPVSIIKFLNHEIQQALKATDPQLVFVTRGVARAALHVTGAVEICRDLPRRQRHAALP